MQLSGESRLPTTRRLLGEINRVPSNAREQRWSKDLLRELFHHFQSTVLLPQPIVQTSQETPCNRTIQGRLERKRPRTDPRKSHGKLQSKPLPTRAGQDPATCV